MIPPKYKLLYPIIMSHPSIHMSHNLALSRCLQDVDSVSFWNVTQSCCFSYEAEVGSPGLGDGMC